MAKPLNETTNGSKEESDLYHIKVPVEVIGIIAKHLIASDLYGTCASLNVVCSDVRYETLPILYKTLVAWGSKWFREAGPPCWGDGPRFLSHRQERQRKQMMEEWAKMRHSAGMEKVHFFAIPPFSFDIHGPDPFFDTGRSPLTRVHAYMAPMLSDDPNGGPPFPIVTIGIKESWEFGGNDLLACVQATMQMADIGGVEVRNALHSAKGVNVMTPASVPDYIPTLQGLASQLASIPLPSDIFRPRMISMGHAPGQESPRYITIALVEMLHWLKLEADPSCENQPQSLVSLEVTKLETILECVKALRRLCKSNHILAGVGYAFRIFDPQGNLDLRNVSSQLNSILAIVRAFYMLAGRHVPVKDFGPFILTFVSDLGDCCWIVQPGVCYGAPPTFIETTMTMNGEKVVLHRDYPKLVGDEG